MRGMAAKLRQTFFRGELDFRVRLFNVFALGGIVISFSMALYSALAVGGRLQAGMNALAGVLAVVLMWYINRGKRCQLGYLITVTLVFVLLFPAMFFTGGGYHSSMPCFFVFAVVFTVLMLEGARRLIFAGLELAVYALCVAGAYRRPELIMPLPGEGAVAVDVMMGLVVVCALLGAVLTALMRLYDGQQRRLDLQNAILAQTNQAKTEFLANASHEMRTPLTVVSVNIQTVEGLLKRMDGPGDPEIAELLSDAQEEIMRLARMVGGMLSLNALSEHTDKTKTDLTALVKGAGEMLRLLLSNRGSELRVEAAEGLTVFGSADLLSQVILNLLQNAGAHTGKGLILLTAETEGGEIAVTVRDNGSGIPAELLPHVFERGVTQGGTGVGLFLCKTVVESHGGRIWIESVPGRGTTVKFNLPAYQGQFGEGVE